MRLYFLWNKERSLILGFLAHLIFYQFTKTIGVAQWYMIRTFHIKIFFFASTINNIIPVSIAYTLVFLQIWISKKGTFQFCFPGWLRIHRNPNWKEFLIRQIQDSGQSKYKLKIFSKRTCNISKILFNLGSYEYLASLESKIGRCPFFWHS